MNFISKQQQILNEEHLLKLVRSFDVNFRDILQLSPSISLPLSLPNLISVDLLIILGERYLFVCCSFCFVKRGNNHHSVHVINTSWKPSNKNSETRYDKTDYILHSYFTVAVLLCSRWETACVKPNAILRRERNGDNSPRTTRIY